MALASDPALLAAADAARAQEPAARRAAIRVLERRVRARAAPESLLHLAELWQQDAEQLEAVALADHQARYDLCHDTPGCDLATVSTDLTAARKSWQRASVRYRQLLRDFTDAEQADAAAYGLGWAWRGMGEDALGDAAFTWLVAARPESSYATHAWLLVGEFAFEAWQADWAREAYSRVAATEDPLRGWALHRRAWSYYRLGDYSSAIDGMKQVIAEPDIGVDLAEEARGDLERFYADAGEMDECCEYHQCRCSGDSARDMLVRLAEMYAEQGQHEAAIQTRRRLISADPDGGGAPLHQAEIVQAYRRLGRDDELLAELARLVSMVDARPQDLVAEAALEHQTRNIAFDLHRSGQATSRLDRIATAARLYALHAARFPTATFAPNIAWAWAVACEELGERSLAAEKFAALAASDPNGRYAARRGGRGKAPREVGLRVESLARHTQILRRSPSWPRRGHRRPSQP